jgi:FkbM family methyltransferase
MWKDDAFRYFVAKTISESDYCDVSIAQAQMATMSAHDQDFFKFIINHLSSVSPSQSAQDLWALYESNGSGNKFFVEFGATDGIHINNTLLLEREYGWTGILAEPNPVWHKSLQENRTAAVEKKCVHSVSGEWLEFMNTDAPELSGIVNKDTGGAARKLGMKGGVIKVETISLNDLLENHHAPTQIDFMSIDTEGWEHEILRTFDFKKWDVRLFCIEKGPVQKDQAIDHMMKENGYVRKFEKFSGPDVWYKKKA